MKKLLIAYHCMEQVRVARRRGNEDRFQVALTSLDRKACQGGLPNRSWYRPVKGRSGEVIGYICGRGLSVVTTLTGTMVPKGVMV